jgi:hypothetical protein
MNTKKFESIARKLPPSVARFGKRFAVHLRARDQLRACRRGFIEYGDQYSQPVLFIAGLPKSGSTWVEKMVSSYDGYHEYLPPSVAKHELQTGGSHDFEMPKGMFDNLSNMLVVTKLHSHGSPNNVDILKEAGINYVVLHRDLRDVAVSYHFYVRNTPWHPEHQHHVDVSVQEGLKTFGERMLPAYIHWVQSWKEHADPNHSVQIRYEDMLQNPIGAMTTIASLFDLDHSQQKIEQIVAQHSFKKMSGGRTRGDSSDSQFARKGIAGDWKNHFSPELREQYGLLLVDFLIETSDEPNDSWITEESITSP